MTFSPVCNATGDFFVRKSLFFVVFASFLHRIVIFIDRCTIFLL